MGTCPGWLLRRQKYTARGFLSFSILNLKENVRAKFENADKSLYVYIGNILH